MYTHSRGRRRVAALVALVAASAATLLVPAAGRAASTGPQDPAQAQVLVDAGPATGGGAVTSISPEQAYSLAIAPATALEIDGGLTLAQSVGLESGSVVSTASTACWRWVPWVQWGTWPYQQKVNDDVSWCAAYGDHITSWSSHVSLGSFLCSPSGPYGYKQAGGVGSGLVRLRAGGYFGCPTTVPWLTYHYNRWFDTSFYTRGSAAIVATS
jgi:hypothetical protein